MDWFTLTLTLSAITSVLILSMRAITLETNPFLFMGVANCIGGVALIVYCLVTYTAMDLPLQAIAMACLTGVTVVSLDLALIFMFRHKAPLTVAMPLMRVGTLLFSTTIGCTFFSESITSFKLAGLVCAGVAIYLLNSKTKQAGDI